MADLQVCRINLTSFLRVPAVPILLSDTTPNMGINTLKPTPRANVYVVLLLEMPAVLQNSNCHLEDDTCYMSTV